MELVDRRERFGNADGVHSYIVIDVAERRAGALDALEPADERDIADGVSRFEGLCRERRISTSIARRRRIGSSLVRTDAGRMRFGGGVISDEDVTEKGFDGIMRISTKISVVTTQMVKSIFSSFLTR